MLSLLEQIQETDSLNSINAIKKRIENLPERERNQLLGYLSSVGATDLANIIFGVDSITIKNGILPIYIPDEPEIYRGNHRDLGGIEIDPLSIKELELLLSAFFQNKKDRDYIIHLIFYKNNFVSKHLSDSIELLSKTDALFKKVGNPKKTILRIVKEEPIEQGVSANDSYFTPLIERIEYIEPGSFDYSYAVDQLRVEYVESIFCDTIRSLADEPRNHIWALDPENSQLYLPEYQRNRIQLIRSICEVHAIIDPGFPQLHDLIPSTLASWILLYKGFSAPAQKIRQILNTP